MSGSMADKQYDIWNDDDGETEAKKSRGSRRILFFGLVLALVLAVVLVAETLMVQMPNWCGEILFWRNTRVKLILCTNWENILEPH